MRVIYVVLLGISVLALTFCRPQTNAENAENGSSNISQLESQIPETNEGLGLVGEQNVSSCLTTAASLFFLADSIGKIKSTNTTPVLPVLQNSDDSINSTTASSSSETSTKANVQKKMINQMTAAIYDITSKNQTQALSLVEITSALLKIYSKVQGIDVSATEEQMISIYFKAIFAKIKPKGGTVLTSGLKTFLNTLLEIKPNLQTPLIVKQISISITTDNTNQESTDCFSAAKSLYLLAESVDSLKENEDATDNKRKKIKRIKSLPAQGKATDTQTRLVIKKMLTNIYTLANKAQDENFTLREFTNTMLKIRNQVLPTSLASVDRNEITNKLTVQFNNHQNSGTLDVNDLNLVIESLVKEDLMAFEIMTNSRIETPPVPPMGAPLPTPPTSSSPSPMRTPPLSTEASSSSKSPPSPPSPMEGPSLPAETPSTEWDRVIDSIEDSGADSKEKHDASE